MGGTVISTNNLSETAVIADARFVFRHPAHFLAFGFGSGLAPIAPGTAGTLAAIPLVVALDLMLPSLAAQFLVLLLVVMVGVVTCDITSRNLKVHDHSGIVIDEFAGYLLTMICFPAHWLYYLLGFVFFRLFDIWKPYPIGWCDRRVSGGIGIMVDDLLAGIYAAICLFFVSQSAWFAQLVN